MVVVGWLSGLGQDPVRTYTVPRMILSGYINHNLVAKAWWSGSDYFLVLFFLFNLVSVNST